MQLRPVDPPDHGVPAARAAEIELGAAQARYVHAVRRTGMWATLSNARGVAAASLEQAQARFTDTRRLLAYRGDDVWRQGVQARSAAFAATYGELPTLEVAAAARDDAAAEERRCRDEVRAFGFLDYDDPLDRVQALERAEENHRAAALVHDAVRDAAPDAR